MARDINAGAEFEKLPIEHLIAGPLVATVKAQAVAAEATRSYIESMIDQETRKPIPVSFALSHQDEQGVVKSTTFDAPLLSIVPVPHLRIDSLDIDFKYSISQTVGEMKSLEWGAEVGAKAKANWGWGSAEATFKGSVQSKSAEDSQVNRAGSLAIKVHASEAPMPEGLARVLTLLAGSVQTSPGGGQKSGN